MIWGKLCNGGRSAMVFQHHCRSSGGGGFCNGGEGLQYNTTTLNNFVEFHTKFHIAVHNSYNFVWNSTKLYNVEIKQINFISWLLERESKINYIKLYFICVTYGLPYFSFRFVSLRFFLFFSFSFVSFLFSLFCFRFFFLRFVFFFRFFSLLFSLFSFRFFSFLFVSFRFFRFSVYRYPC